MGVSVRTLIKTWRRLMRVWPRCLLKHRSYQVCWLFLSGVTPVTAPLKIQHRGFPLTLEHRKCWKLQVKSQQK